MATRKNTTPIFIDENNPSVFSHNVSNRIGLHCSMFSKLLIGQVCTKKYYKGDIIPYNPDQ